MHTRNGGVFRACAHEQEADMRVDLKRVVIAVLFVSLCGGAYAQATGADGGGTKAGTAASSGTGVGKDKGGTGKSMPNAGDVTRSTSGGSGARPMESTPAPAQNQIDTRSATEAPASGSGLKKPY